MVMPAGASPGRRFMTIRLYEPLRRLPQMLMTLSCLAMVAPHVLANGTHAHDISLRARLLRSRHGEASGCKAQARSLLWNAGLVAHLGPALDLAGDMVDRKSTRLNSSHLGISYAVFCLKKKKTNH